MRQVLDLSFNFSFRYSRESPDSLQGVIIFQGILIHQLIVTGESLYW